VDQGRGLLPDFPERFANGDVTNDPPGTKEWGGSRRRGIFRGDLSASSSTSTTSPPSASMRSNLNSIFASNSNHNIKRRTTGIIDPHFGDDRRSVNSWIPATHAGFGLFLTESSTHGGRLLCVCRREEERSALALQGWYIVPRLFRSDLSVRQNYECWWGHGSLPKLNTQNPEVRNTSSM